MRTLWMTIKEAKEGYRKILGDSLRSDPGALITNPNNRLKQLRSGPYVYPVVSLH